MPSIYAHRRMGQQVRKELTGQCKEAIEAWPELYAIGLQGPDILFYYKPLFKDRVNAVGHELHRRAGTVFFENASKAVRESPQPQAALSYAYGALSHFALDVTCHPYVDEKIKASGVSHTEIEVEFDRFLMLDDGLDPVSCVLTEGIVPSAANAAVIAPFYPGVTAMQIQKALRSMIFYNRLLLARSNAKRKVIRAVLQAAGHRELQGLVINPQGNPDCADSSQRLKELCGLAKECAKGFVEDFDAYLAGKGPLPELFDLSFGGTRPESGERE